MRVSLREEEAPGRNPRRLGAGRASAGRRGSLDQRAEVDETRSDSPDAVTVTAVEALDLAMWLHRAGRLQEAESVYRAVLRGDPHQPDALHYLGVLHHQLGNAEAAVEMIRASLRNAPNNANAWSNLGNVLRATGDRDAAMEAYRKAVEIDPGNPAAHNNLGIVLKELDRLDEAEAAYRRAIDVDPGHAEAYRNLGHVLKRLQRIPEALDAYAKAVVLRPESASYRNLSYSLYRAGQSERAVEVIREWLAHEPGNSIAMHLLAAFSGENVPDRAADEFVREVFDGFAETFDDKLKHLQYRAPELVAGAIERTLGQPRSALRVLDAGCGTGLCGPLLRPWAAQMTGVDLSPGMLARARNRRVYDALVAAEITAYLRETAEAFDLIASADTLVYFGDLGTVLAAAVGALGAGGHMVFTLEEIGGEGLPQSYRLNPHGRYSHTRDYARRALEAAGLEMVEVASVTLRLEAGEPVAGLLCVAHRPGSRASAPSAPEPCQDRAR